MASAATFTRLVLPPMIRGLKNAAAFIAKGEQHAKDNNIDPEEYTTARIYPDMQNFCFQVYRFTDAVKYIPHRVDPSFEELSLPDVETTFPDLLARIQRTIEYLEKFEATALDGKETAKVVIAPAGPAWSITFDAIDYVQFYAQPNFWFHVTTAYDILRMKGVPVGKLDFLNGAGLIKVDAGGEKRE